MLVVGGWIGATFSKICYKVVVIVCDKLYGLFSEILIWHTTIGGHNLKLFCHILTEF